MRGQRDRCLARAACDSRNAGHIRRQGKRRARVLAPVIHQLAGIDRTQSRRPVVSCASIEACHARYAIVTSGDVVEDCRAARPELLFRQSVENGVRVPLRDAGMLVHQRHHARHRGRRCGRARCIENASLHLDHIRILNRGVQRYVRDVALAISRNSRRALPCGLAVDNAGPSSTRPQSAAPAAFVPRKFRNVAER